MALTYNVSALKVQDVSTLSSALRYKKRVYRCHQDIRLVHWNVHCTVYVQCIYYVVEAYSKNDKTKQSEQI